ncbi:MAG: SDR family oxidoreductase [Enterocloster asparagiformis]|nr:SDR family oxidoreductase [Enterocloster asparagiformis]
MSLEGKKALVTGSSRGIGSAVAAALAREGAEVIVHYAGRGDKAAEVAAEIREQNGVCRVVQADLSDPEGAEILYGQAGDVDILVLNASMQFRRPWQEITREEFYTQVNCNFLSSLVLIQKMAPAMQEKRWGRIITIGSVQEEKPHPEMLVYSSTKAAQTMMAKSLALQLAKDGITVNNVAPGVIYTDRNKDALSDPEYSRRMTAGIPLGYYGDKRDLAGIVKLLCSEEGRYITGQSIFVDGGMSL